MSTTVLITIMADAPKATHPRIRRALSQRGQNDVWQKKWVPLSPTEINLGSQREVGLMDPLMRWGMTKPGLLRAVAEQTRQRVIAAVATRVIVTAQDIDDAPAVTLLTDGGGGSMKPLLALCLLLVGCAGSVSAPEPSPSDTKTAHADCADACDYLTASGCDAHEITIVCRAACLPDVSAPPVRVESDGTLIRYCYERPQ